MFIEQNLSLFVLKKTRETAKVQIIGILIDCAFRKRWRDSRGSFRQRAPLPKAVFNIWLLKSVFVLLF